MSNNVS